MPAGYEAGGDGGWTSQDGPAGRWGGSYRRHAQDLLCYLGRERDGGRCV